MAAKASGHGLLDMDAKGCPHHFDQPKILPCGHLVCRHCIVTRMEMNFTKPDAGCPICRSAIMEGQEKKAGQTMQEMVDDLPTDLAMAALVDAQTVLSNKHVCCVCENSASTLCLDCGDVFCKSCKTMHTKQNMAKNHKLEEFSALTTETLAARRPVMCGEHKKEKCTAYCPKHNVSVCHQCEMSVHRQCQQVVSMEARTKDTVAELDDLTKQLSDGKWKLDVGVEQLDQHIKDMQKHADDAINEIQATQSRLELAVKEFCQRQENHVRKAHEEVEKGTNDVKAALLHRREKVSSHEAVTERAKKQAERYAVADAIDKLRARIADLSRNVTAPLGKEVKSFTFTLDPKAVDKIEEDLSRLGSITYKPLALKLENNNEP